MGQTRLKTTYNEISLYGATEQKTIYLRYNSSCDIVTILDENGCNVFSFDDTMDNNMFDAIQKLLQSYCNNDLLPDVFCIDESDRRILDESYIDDIPRRNKLYLNTDAEKSIHSAIQEVKKVGADPVLTDIVVLLGKAKDMLSDYVDNQNLKQIK